MLASRSAGGLVRDSIPTRDRTSRSHIERPRLDLVARCRIFTWNQYVTAHFVRKTVYLRGKLSVLASRSAAELVRDSIPARDRTSPPRIDRWGLDFLPRCRISVVNRVEVLSRQDSVGCGAGRVRTEWVTASGQSTDGSLGWRQELARHPGASFVSACGRCCPGCFAMRDG